METKNILVTGGAGFIGSQVAIALQDKYDVTVLDNFYWNEKLMRKNLKGFEGNIIKADLRDYNFDKLKNKPDAIVHKKLIRNLQRPNVIIHGVAITDTTVKDSKLIIDVNFRAFKKILDYAEKNGVDVVYASSASVYGNRKVPMKESQKPQLLSFYAESKWLMDRLVLDKIKNSKIKIVGLRYFNVYGPGEGHKGKMASMILQLYKQMKQKKRPRIFHDGNQTRDFVYIKDVVNATILAMDTKRSGIYNVGSGKSISFNKVIQVLNKNMGTSYKPEYIMNNPYTHFQESTLADLSLAKRFLKYEPNYSIERGIMEYVKILEGENGK
ncbi:MAG: ADP-glyceromanno-heptose 6-epimerase [Nanoarchaeota archaeon]